MKIVRLSVLQKLASKQDASSRSKKQRHIAENAAILAGAGATVPKVLEPFLGKEVKRYDPSKPVHIYYTDPARGKGHYQQAQNIAKALKNKGVAYKLINVDEAFSSAEDLKDMSEKYKKRMSGELSASQWRKEWLRFYATKLDRGALVSSANKAGAVIVTNSNVTPWLKGSKLPANVVISDPSKTFTDIPLGTSWTRAQDVKYVPRTAAGYKGKNVKTIDNVPLDPDTFKQAPSLGKMSDTTKFHVTLSGGGLGTDVDLMAKQLLESGATTANGKPVVFHAISGGMQKSNPDAFKRLNALAAANPGRLVVHGNLKPEGARNLLQETALNVMRPHGTMGSEAIVAKKPVMWVARGGKDSAGNLKWAPGMNTNNAQKFSEMTGLPIAGLGGKTTSSTLVDNFKASLGDLGSVEKKVKKAASGFSDTATKIVEDLQKKPRIYAPGKIPFSGRTAAAGGGLALAGLGYKVLRKKRQRSQTENPKIPKIG